MRAMLWVAEAHWPGLGVMEGLVSADASSCVVAVPHPRELGALEYELTHDHGEVWGVGLEALEAA